MTTLTAAAAGGAWMTAATWSPAQQPTSGDDCVLSAGSGAVTVDAGSVCRSINMTGYANTLTHTAGVTLTIGDGTPGLLNVACVLAGTYTLGNATTSQIVFASTSATQQTINFGGKTTGQVTINGAGSSYQLITNGVAMGSGTNLVLTQGTLDTNGRAVTAGAFVSSGALTRALTMGASTFTLAGASPWLASGTGLTLTANTSVITMSGAGPAFAGNGLTYATVTFTGTLASLGSITGANTFTNLNITPGASKLSDITIAADQTVTTAFDASGNSLTNRLFLRSSVVGTPRTITAAGVTLANVDCMDMIGAGAGTWSGTSVGNGQGNTGITFTPSVTRFKTGGTGSFSSTTMWSATDGGASGASVPLCHDTIKVNANSGTGTFTFDLPRIGDIDFTNAATATYAESASTPQSYFGSVVFNSAVAGTYSTNGKTFRSRSASSFTAATKTIGAMTVETQGATLTLSDAYAGTTITINHGGLTASSSVSATTVTQASTAGTLTLGTNTWTLTSTGAVWTISATVVCNTSTIAITDVSGSSKTFAGGGQTYHNLTITTGGAGAVIISGANTFDSLAVTGGGTKNITLPAATTTTLTANSFFTGAPGNLITIISSTNGSAATLSAPVRITSDYISLKDNSAVGPVTPFLAGQHSTLVSNTPGWSLVPPQGGTMTMMGV